MMPLIAIVGGTGPEGLGLALRFARAGAHIRIGSRNLDHARAATRRVTEAVQTSDGQVQGLLNDAAVREAEVVILTVPFAAQADTLGALRSSFRNGAILVDATVQLQPTGAESSALLAARQVPEGVSVVAAFHTLSAGLLADLSHPIDSDILICADSAEAAGVVRELVGLLPGARAVDAGPLKNARLVENLVPLLIALNRRHKVRHAGVRITGL